MVRNNRNKKRDKPDTENRFNFTHEIKQLSPEDQLVVFLARVRWKRILDRLLARRRVNHGSEPSRSKRDVDLMLDQPG
jgi:hypothetical protein